MTSEIQIVESQTSLPDQLIIKSSSSSTKSTGGAKAKLIRSHIPVKKCGPQQLMKKLKPKTPLVKRYFTSGHDINEKNRREATDEPSPFQYPKDLEVFAHKVMTKAWRNDVRLKELKMSCFKKPSHKDRQKRDLLNRLYVEEPKLMDVKTILELAPEYFKIVEGRPIPDHLDIRQYIETVRESLRTKIINGYREDDIMLIEENILLEQKIIDTIRDNYDKYVNAFEEFLYRDHTSSMKLLKDSEIAAQEAYDKYSEYKTVLKKFGAIRSSIYNSEEKWRNCQMYEKFLFLVSPFSWRVQRFSKYGSDTTEEEMDEHLFLKYQLSQEEHEMSLTNLLDQFKDKKDEVQVPELYFTSAEQLIDVFRFMEMQNLNSLLHSEELAVPLEQVRDGMREAEAMFDEEINNLQEMIDKLEGGISWEEERAKYLEDLALKLIGNEFKNLIMADEVLNLHVFVEDVYETRIGPNDANLGMAEMMRAIETKYRNELLAMDKVPAEQVAMLERGCYAEQMMMMRLAEKAAKQYSELQRVTSKLNKAFAPPFVKVGGKELKKRSPPHERRLQQVVQQRDLTPGEAEYLDYFTDFCKYADDPKDYGIDVTGIPGGSSAEENVH
ncbi:cilia- and flagella-associated protein 100-like isoform X2 [Sitophilus oryzae]|uniref:Cilia- and flagella-associated protein 100-like isoform X2 n=1 Tax=Sitophilus oryzae TaxID=7048 RepID=A0A6J2YTQ6_SITOR|nr:cilia- and flagella-associated protein 100-like isoform X2 [Sitophilus oryzae]